MSIPGPIFAVIAALAASFPAAAQAQTYTTADLLDQNTARGDGNGNFNVYWTVPPAFDGTHIAFVNSGPTAQEIWVTDVATGAKTKLLDTTVKVPGGKGTFSSFVPPNNNLSSLGLTIAAGKLFFFAYDSTGSNGYGLYWIPLAGGKVRRVANYNTPAPEGGKLTFIGSYAVSGDLVLFNTSVGVYVGTTVGTAPVVVADANTQILIGAGPFYYSGYVGAAINGTTVAVTATNGLDPSRGVNVIFVGTYTDFASLSKQPVVSQSQTLPGDTDATPHLDVISDAIFLYNDTLFFGAQDTFASSAFYGYYTAQFGANGAPLNPGGSPIYKVFDNVTSGLTGSFGNFGSASFDHGTLGFVGTSTATGTEGIYLSSGPFPVLLSTDLQRGIAVPVPIFGGRAAFTGAGFFDPQVDYVAPTACGVARIVGVRTASGAITAGANPGQYTRTITVTNYTKAALPGPIDVELVRLTAGATLENASGVTACTTPAGIPYITAVAAGASLARGASAAVTLDIYSPANASFTYTPVILTGTGTP